MNRNHFNAQMARMGIAFGEEMSTPRMLVYWDRVKNHSDETFTDAANRILGLRVNVWVSVLVLALGAALYVHFGRRAPADDDPPELAERQTESQNAE